MTDESHLGIAWPIVDDLASGWQRDADRVETLDENAVVLHGLEHVDAHASHDSHRADYVRRVGQLDAYLGDGSTDGAHAVGYDVHGAALHAAGQATTELVVHVFGTHPVAHRAALETAQVERRIGLFEAVRRRRDRVGLKWRADHRARLDSGNIRRIG